MRIPVPLASTRDNHSRQNIERLINCYLQQAAPQSDSQFSILGTPGSFQIADLGPDQVRGLRYWQNTLYAVSGGQLFSVAANGQANALGPISSAGRVTMVEVPAGLVILAGNQLKQWDGTNFTDILVPANANYSNIPQSIAVINNSLVVGVGGDFYVWSEPNEPANIGALSFARAERNGDETIVIFADHNELLLFGRRTIEVKYDTGIVAGRFQSVGNGMVQRGCAAADSVTQVDNSVVWLGDDRRVYRLNGRTPVPLSSHGMETQMQSYQDVSDAVGMTYTWNGHVFYVLTFPGNNVTWQIDLSTGSVAERESFGEDHFRARCFDSGYQNDPIFGDWFSGKIHCLSDEYHLENGTQITRTVVTPYIDDDRRRFTTVRLEIDIDSGEAPISGPSSSPQLHMRHTDNGKTWSQQRSKSLGMTGEYLKRIKFHRVGQSRKRAYELVMWDAVPFRLNAIHAEIERGLL